MYNSHVQSPHIVVSLGSKILLILAFIVVAPAGVHSFKCHDTNSVTSESGNKSCHSLYTIALTENGAGRNITLKELQMGSSNLCDDINNTCQLLETNLRTLFICCCDSDGCNHRDHRAMNAEIQYEQVLQSNNGPLCGTKPGTDHIRNCSSRQSEACVGIYHRVNRTVYYGCSSEKECPAKQPDNCYTITERFLCCCTGAKCNTKQSVLIPYIEYLSSKPTSDTMTPTTSMMMPTTKSTTAIPPSTMATTFLNTADNTIPALTNSTTPNVFSGHSDSPTIKSTTSSCDCPTASPAASPSSLPLIVLCVAVGALALLLALSVALHVHLCLSRRRQQADEARRNAKLCPSSAKRAPVELSSETPTTTDEDLTKTMTDSDPFATTTDARTADSEYQETTVDNHACNITDTLY